MFKNKPTQNFQEWGFNPHRIYTSSINATFHNPSFKNEAEVGICCAGCYLDLKISIYYHILYKKISILLFYVMQFLVIQKCNSIPQTLCMHTDQLEFELDHWHLEFQNEGKSLSTLVTNTFAKVGMRKNKKM